MGALVMAHSDDNGLVLPPNLAPIQVVIVPIYKTREELQTISAKVDEIIPQLKARGISVKYDDNDSKKPGWKFAEYELKGVPVRLAMGPRDLMNGTVEVARRDNLTKEVVPVNGIADTIEKLLTDIQENIFSKALTFRNENIRKADTWEEFKTILTEKGGFISAHWDGTTETELKIKEETKATIRCIPIDAEPETGKCIYSGQPSQQRVLFAIAY
jgi:prolyl-tRNA synthetase